MTMSIKDTLLLALMLLAAGLAAALRPTASMADMRPPVSLQAMVPSAFGEWTEQAGMAAAIVNPQQQETLDRTYSDTLSRSYVNKEGYRIMLSVAYGKTQRGDLQLHHPEVCYPAQGFEVRSSRAGQLATKSGALPVRRLETLLNVERNEPVTYWAMIGDHVVLDSARRKLVEMRYGLQGQVVDGFLFRVSSIEKNSSSAFEHQAIFVSAMLDAFSPVDRRRVAGI